MEYVEKFVLFGTEVAQIPCIKGNGKPSTETAGAVGCLYMDEDTGAVYKCVAVTDGAYTWVHSEAWRLTAEGGVIFGDESNKALGEASVASGAKYPIENDDVEYALDANLDEIVPDEAWRYNEAVGTASTAMGMGNVAFARASKAFGFRTQTGYPPSKEWLAKRPEIKGERGIYLGSLSLLAQKSHQVDMEIGSSKEIEVYYTLKADAEVSIFAYFYAADGAYISPRTLTLTEGISKMVAISVPDGSAKMHLALNANTDCTVEDLCFWFGAIGENVGQAAVALGADTAALGNHDIAAGWRAIARGYSSFAFGSAESYSEAPTEASGYGSVAIGQGAKASGRRSVAIGKGAEASGELSFATGTSKALNTHATAIGVNNTNEGYGGFASGSSNKLEKLSTDGTAAYYGFVGNSNNVVKHTASAAFGYGNTTSIKYQLMAGVCNSNDSALANAYFKVGCGTSANRKTAFAVMSNADVLVGGKSVHSGADYAEFFEWQDGNPNADDRIGMLVALDGDKIRPAMPGDDVIGIVSGTATVVGDSAAMYWKEKYLTDEFGRTIYDMVEDFVEVPDPETGEMVKVSTGLMPQPRLNPDYDPDTTYIPREERKEWDQIGMMGKLYTRDDGTCAAGDYGCPGENGVLTKSETPTNIRVMKRTGDNIVLVLLK